jgi:23S rRNA pseudouridine2457 synthase
MDKAIPVHYKIYKPVGMLSQFYSGEAKQRHKKRFLGDLYNFPKATMAVGRLDEKSEGLLLLTSDGGLSHNINTSGYEKEYWVQLDGVMNKNALARIRTGVEIGLFGKRYTTKACKASIIGAPETLPRPDAKLRVGAHRPTSWIRITLTEGKFRQIRKMTAAVGFPTVRLVRVRIGNIHLGDLKPGDVMPIELSLEKLCQDGQLG